MIQTCPLPLIFESIDVNCQLKRPNLKRPNLRTSASRSKTGRTSLEVVRAAAFERALVGAARMAAAQEIDEFRPAGREVGGQVRGFQRKTHLYIGGRDLVRHA